MGFSRPHTGLVWGLPASLGCLVSAWPNVTVLTLETTKLPGDPRGRQVAVVADSLLESLIPLLEEERWGVIQLPPRGLEDETVGAWLDHVAEHVCEFRRNGYAVVLIDDGSWGERVDAALDELRVPPLPRAEGTREGLAQLRRS